MNRYTLALPIGNTAKKTLLTWLVGRGYSVLSSGSGNNEVWVELDKPIAATDMTDLKGKLWGLLISEIP